MKKIIVVFLSICLALGACTGVFAASPTSGAAADAGSKLTASVPVARSAALKHVKAAVQPLPPISKEIIIRFLTIIKKRIEERLQQIDRIIDRLNRDRTFIALLKPPPARQKEFIRNLTLRIRYYEDHEKQKYQKQLKEITELIDKLKKEK